MVTCKKISILMMKVINLREIQLTFKGVILDLEGFNNFNIYQN